MKHLLNTALVFLLLPRAVLGAPQENDEFAWRVLSSNRDGAVFEFSLPRPTFERVTRKGTSYSKVILRGFGTLNQPGKPALPIRGVLMGIPAHGRAKIESIEVKTVKKQRMNILPAQQTLFTPTASFGYTVEHRFYKNTSFYKTSALFPAEAARVGFEGVIRGQKVAQLLLYPFRVNPRTGLFLYHRWIRVRLSFSSPQPAAPPLQ